MALFSTNMKLLVIHHDTILLHQIQQMCDRCNYVVTLCTSPYHALNLLAETNGYFDMMLIDVSMPNMDSYEFVRYITLQHNIPVIVMSCDETTTSVIKSVTHGACDYWLQPLHEKQFKTMWQHVARKKLNEHQVVGFLKAQNPKEDQVVGFLEAQHKRKRESEETSAKNSRLSWTPQLHKQFLNAVNKLGLNEAKPRKIIEIMDVCGLTKAQVASHLQKYRDRLKRETSGKKSKKTPRIDTPTECINKTVLQQCDEHAPESHHAEPMLQQQDQCDDQVSDLLLDLDDELISLLF